MFMKEWICTIAGLAGGFIAAIFGGWDSALVTLLIFMGADFLTFSHSSSDQSSQKIRTHKDEPVSYTHLKGGTTIEYQENRSSAN